MNNPAQHKRSEVAADIGDLRRDARKVPGSVEATKLIVVDIAT
jgi:hypothetical protein